MAEKIAPKIETSPLLTVIDAQSNPIRIRVPEYDPHLAEDWSPFHLNFAQNHLGKFAFFQKFGITASFLPKEPLSVNGVSYRTRINDSASKYHFSPVDNASTAPDIVLKISHYKTFDSPSGKINFPVWQIQTIREESLDGGIVRSRTVFSNEDSAITSESRVLEIPKAAIALGDPELDLCQTLTLSMDTSYPPLRKPLTTFSLGTNDAFQGGYVTHEIFGCYVVKDSVKTTQVAENMYYPDFVPESTDHEKWSAVTLNVAKALLYYFAPTLTGKNLIDRTKQERQRLLKKYSLLKPVLKKEAPSSSPTAEPEEVIFPKTELTSLTEEQKMAFLKNVAGLKTQAAVALPPSAQIFEIEIPAENIPTIDGLKGEALCLHFFPQDNINLSVKSSQYTNNFYFYYRPNEPIESRLDKESATELLNLFNSLLISSDLSGVASFSLPLPEILPQGVNLETYKQILEKCQNDYRYELLEDSFDDYSILTPEEKALLKGVEEKRYQQKQFFINPSSA